MATLKQNENYKATFLGWYGKCGQPECVDFDLSSTTVIAKVYQFTEDGIGIRTYVSQAEQYMQGFHELKCGNAYWIVLKPGTSEVEIPEFIQGQYSSAGKDLGMISNDCGLRDTETKPFTDDTKDCDCDDTTPIKPCTKDLRVCSDGSTVGRDGANGCHFPPCNFSMVDYKDARARWKSKQPTYYKFNFAWSCFCTEAATRQVTITVKYGRVVHIKAVGTSEEISLGQNEGTETESDKPPVPFKYLSMEGLFRWLDKELKKHPFSIVATYDDTYGYMKGAFVDRIQEMADEELGFHISAFEELSFDGKKCPSDYKKCPDGTLLKRDPNNNCRFPECPDIPDETPKSVSDIPKLKFRWLTRGSRSTLQVANAMNPWVQSTDENQYLSWRTVYGSRVVNPSEVNSSHWKPLDTSDAYADEYGDTWEYSDIDFSLDGTNNNHIMVALGQTNDFIPDPEEIEDSSHLYLFRDDSEKSMNKSWTFPVIMKNKSKISGVMGCPEDVKICSDGTTLVRNPDNDCEFDECDEEIGFAMTNEETPFSIEEGFGDFAPTPTSETQFADGDATPTPAYDTGDSQLTDDGDSVNIPEGDIVLGDGFGYPTPDSDYIDPISDDDSSDDADSDDSADFADDDSSDDADSDDFADVLLPPPDFEAGDFADDDSSDDADFADDDSSDDADSDDFADVLPPPTDFEAGDFADDDSSDDDDSDDSADFADDDSSDDGDSDDFADVLPPPLDFEAGDFADDDSSDDADSDDSADFADDDSSDDAGSDDFADVLLPPPDFEAGDFDADSDDSADVLLPPPDFEAGDFADDDV